MDKKDFKEIIKVIKNYKQFNYKIYRGFVWGDNNISNPVVIHINNIEFKYDLSVNSYDTHSINESILNLTYSQRKNFKQELYNIIYNEHSKEVLNNKNENLKKIKETINKIN